uniref:25S rRNA (uridine-N(3))-methyltransferase BMT5-like domain-containing protein n=1 Tax=Nelumbo nucifera TaxID=4432 RepID=A0A822Z066_NELNU|nr:TPA_asm: hypothetical protein HUJ06_007732 [Nelumbo nucifera]
MEADETAEEAESEARRNRRHVYWVRRLFLFFCLAKAFGSVTNMVATSLDNEDSLECKYSYAIGNVIKLEEMGCVVVLYRIDATKMSHHFFLKTQRFDRIVYNFPHVGFLYPKASYCQIELNKKLVKGFMENAMVLKGKGGNACDPIRPQIPTKMGCC